MLRKRYIAVVFVLLFDFFQLQGQEKSNGTAFTDKILSNQLKLSDKLSLLSEKSYQINDKDATQLLEYLNTCDKDLFIPISSLILQHKENVGYAGKIYDIMLIRRKELVSKPEDIVPFITYLNDLLSLHISTLPQTEQKRRYLSEELLKGYERLTDELLSIIHQMPPEKQEETINVIFSGDTDNGLLELLQITNTERLIKNSLKSIESRNENEIKLSLLIINKLDISNYYSDETFLSKMASLTLHGNPEISNLSNEILERCTGVKGGNNFNWIDWLSKNSLVMRGDIALSRLKDSNLSVTERINALDLICSANYGKWTKTNNAFKTITSLIYEDNIPFSLRSELLGRLVYIASVDSASAPGKHIELRDSVLDSIRQLFDIALKNKNEELLMRVIRVVCSLKLIDTDSKIRNELYEILANDSYGKHIQLVAFSKLSQVKFRKKEVAKKLLDFYERCKIFNYNESNDELIQILLALQEITGKSAQDNKTLKLFRAVEFWRKAVSEMPDDPPEEKDNAGAGKE